jgi:IS30 family transposase
MGKAYRHLSVEERIEVQVQTEQGLSARAIARALKRAATTVTRERKRNGWQRARQTGRPRKPSGYSAAKAQTRATRMAGKPRVQRKLLVGSAAWVAVLEQFAAGLSPEQAARTLKRMHPENQNLHFSHETIYQAIYAMPRGELRAEVIALLRFGRSKRRPRTRGKDRRGQIPNAVSIHDRPTEIEQRLVPGHWEGDTIKGRYNRSAVGTLVERKTLFVTLARMNGTGSEAAVKGFSSVLSRIDSQHRLSMTYDRGKEMTRHRELTQQTGIQVYFADPHSPWQRGINENTNGLLRQYLPKGDDLSRYSQDDLDAIAWALNTRPRKSLDWKCPAEVFLPNFDFVKYWHRNFNPVALRP